MNTTNYIRIFRGDDSDALGYQTIVGTIKTDLDLTGCKAVFRFLGFYAEFDPIPEDKKLTIVVPAQASRGFPPGVGYASLKVLDALGKIRTFTNRIPVIVDTMTPSCGCGEFEVSFSPFPELEPLKIFVGPNANDFDQYTGFISKIIDRASLVKYGLAILVDAMSEDSGASGKAASPAAVKAAYDAIITTLTDNYYNAEQTEEAIDRVAAYYITRNAAGDAFETKAQLDSTTVFYSGGKVRTPTRNDYCVVLADETHEGAEYRYIYAVADGETTGSWQPQFPVEGVMTVDQTVMKNSQNPVSGGGVWKALWGALSALPTGFSSLYDWCVDQLAGKASKADATLTPVYSDAPTFGEWTVVATNPVVPGPYTVKWNANSYAWDFYSGAEVFGSVKNQSTDAVAVTLTQGAAAYTATRTRTDIIGYTLGSQTNKQIAAADPLLFAQYYPEGDVKSAAEFTSGIKYDAPDTENRTITVKPFCNTGTAANDNSSLVGRVVIPPFVDAQGNGYISDDGTRYKVVGVSGYYDGLPAINNNLTAIVAPNTVTTIGGYAFTQCDALTTVLFSAATDIGDFLFYSCGALTSISLTAATSIGECAFQSCPKLTSVSLPATTDIGDSAFAPCPSLASVDFGDTPRSSVPTLGADAFNSVPTSCKIIVPDAQYDEWIAASGWSDLVSRGYKFLRHSEWEYARKYELDGKLDKSGGTVTGELGVGAGPLPNFQVVPEITEGDYIPPTMWFGDGAGVVGITWRIVDGSVVMDVSDVLGATHRIALPSSGGTLALSSAIPYSLGTPITIDTVSSEVVEGETVYYGAATLDNRTANIVQVTAATALDELRITFPAATSGKVRDFGLRVEIGTGSAALAAPALVPIAPTGETIKLENNAAEIPALADGTATAKGVTLLYFSETAPGVFLVKGEQVEEVL